MNLLQLFRHHQLRRKLFAVLMLSWLQMILLPCVMGHDVMTHDVAGSVQHAETPAAMHGAHEHDAHAMDMAGMADMDGMNGQDAGSDCVHCPPQDDDGAQRCAYPHDTQADSRAPGQLSGEHLDFHAILIEVTALSADRVAHTPPAQYVTPPPRARALFLTCCVQLK